MKRDFVRDIYADTDSYAGREVTLGGWVRNLRDSKAFGFIDLNDGSCHKNVQVVFERDKIDNYDDMCISVNPVFLIKKLSKRVARLRREVDTPTFLPCLT